MERNSGDARRKDRERIMVQEGIELWKLKKQEQQAHKIQEQREVRRTYIYVCVCVQTCSETKWLYFVWEVHDSNLGPLKPL
jgi:hypothetical protein